MNGKLGAYMCGYSDWQIDRQREEEKNREREIKIEGIHLS